MLRHGLLALLSLAFAQSAFAQTPPAATEAAPAATAAPPTATAPPLLVVVLGERNTTSAWVPGVCAALTEGLAPLVRGRPVMLLSETAELAPFAACRTAECLGQAVAGAQGIGALIARLHVRDPRTLDVQLELVDPISGAARHEPVRGQVPAAARSAPTAALAPLLAELAAAMPTPPAPPATLLITVTADDASIVIDGHDVGRSPIAPISMPAGRYTVVVTRDGYETLTRLVQVGDTGPTRADFDLVPGERTVAAMEASPTGTLAATDHTSAHATSTDDASETPIYARWYVIAGAAAVVVATVVIIAVASSGGDTLAPNGIPIPPIVR